MATRGVPQEADLAAHAVMIAQLVLSPESRVRSPESGSVLNFKMSFRTGAKRR